MAGVSKSLIIPDPKSPPPPVCMSENQPFVRWRAGARRRASVRANHGPPASRFGGLRAPSLSWGGGPAFLRRCSHPFTGLFLSFADYGRNAPAFSHHGSPGYSRIPDGYGRLPPGLQRRATSARPALPSRHFAPSASKPPCCAHGSYRAQQACAPANHYGYSDRL